MYNIKWCAKCDRMLSEISGSYYCWECKGFVEPKAQIDKTTECFPSAAKSENKAVAAKQQHICSHNQTKVTVGDYMVWCSEKPQTNWQRQNPDLGIYFAEVWTSIVSPAWSTCDVNLGLSAYPAVFLDWPDYGMPEFDALCKTISYAVKKIREGQQIEIGCYGGHGRTGTFLACLFVAIEGLTAEEAIDWVHRTYCHEAIESKSQEKIIKQYAERK